jgi:hypothetical protein
MSFFKSGEQKGKTLGPVWRLVPGGGGVYKENMKEGKSGGDIMYSCMKMEK